MGGIAVAFIPKNTNPSLQTASLGPALRRRGTQEALTLRQVAVVGVGRPQARVRDLWNTHLGPCPFSQKQ